MSLLKVKKIGVIFNLVFLLGIACCFTRESATTIYAKPDPNPSLQAVINGIFRISNLSDVKVFQVYLAAEEEYETNLRLDTIGTASLQLTVTCLEGPAAGIPITLYNQVFEQKAEIVYEQRIFVAPDEGWYEFRLGLSEHPWNGNACIPPYLLAVYFQLLDVGKFSNSRTREAGPGRTPLLDSRWYIGDDATPAYWDYLLPLESNSTYYFCTCFTFPINGTGCPANSVLVSAILYPPGENTFYPIACEGVLNESVLKWRTVWFGTPEGGTHLLRVRIDAAAIFRACIAITVSHERVYEPPGAPENNTSVFELSGDNLTFTVGTVAVIAVGGSVMAMSSRRRKKQSQGSGGSVRRGNGLGGG